MGNILSRVAPNKVAPGIIAPRAQNADFKKYFGAITNNGDTSAEKLYITTVEALNTEAAVSQQWQVANSKQGYALGQIGLNYYFLQAYLEFDEKESAAFEALSNGVGLLPFLESCAKQAINQKRHKGALFGFGANEGLLANAIAVNMVADSGGKTKLTEYNVSDLQARLATQAREVMNATMNTSKPVVVASSVRVINYLKTALVPTATAVFNGSVESVAGVYGKILSDLAGTPVEFIADDLLKAGVNGDPTNDFILFIAPGSESIDIDESVSQDLVGDFNSIPYNTVMDSAEGLREYTRPEDLGVFSKKLVLKTTPGAALRSEAVRKLSIQY